MSMDAFAKRTASLHAWCIEFGRSLNDAFHLRYEEMVQGLWEQPAQYLEIPLSGSGEVDPAVSHVVRTKAAGDWKNWLTAEDAVWFAPHFQAYLREYGYPLDWTMNRKPVIDRAHGLDYVTRMVKRKRRLMAMD